MISLNNARHFIASAMIGALSLFAAGQTSAQSIAQPPVVSAVDANGVNLADGTYQLPGLDVGIGGSGSGIARVTQGASDNYSGIIAIEALPVTFNGSQATEALFYNNVSFGGTTYRFQVGHYVAGGGSPWASGPYFAVGSNVMLTCTGAASDVQNQVGSCTLILPDGTKAYYDKTKTSGTGFGPLQTITKPDGEIISLTYNMSGSNATGLLSVSSTLGWMLKYETNKVTAINTAVTYCDPAATTCSVSSSYPYATQSVSGGTTTIARNGINVLSYTGSAGTSVTLTSPMGVTKTVNVTGGKVSSVVVAGQTWNYSYSTDGYGNTTTTVQAPNLTIQKLVVTYNHMIVSKTDEAGRTATYQYYSNGLLYKAINPDGNANTGGYTVYYYDANRVNETDVVPKGGASGGVTTPGAAIVTKASYIACDTVNFTNINYCNKPQTTTDANGVVTTYAYDGYGNLTSTTLPAVNGVRPQTRYAYAQYMPHLLNSAGSLIAQTPVSRLIATSSCMTADLNGCVGGTDELKTTLDYNYTNVLPYTSTISRGDGSLAQTTTSSLTDNVK